MDIDKLRRFVTLEKQRRELEGELKVIAEERSMLEAQLLKEFEKAGMSSTKIDGLNVRVERMLFATVLKGFTKMDVCKALKRSRLGSLVQNTYQPGQLAAYVRELEREEKPLPKALSEVIEIGEKYVVRSNRPKGGGSYGKQKAR